MEINGTTNSHKQHAEDLTPVKGKIYLIPAILKFLKMETDPIYHVSEYKLRRWSNLKCEVTPDGESIPFPIAGNSQGPRTLLDFDDVKEWLRLRAERVAVSRTPEIIKEKVKLYQRRRREEIKNAKKAGLRQAEGKIQKTVRLASAKEKERADREIAAVKAAASREIKRVENEVKGLKEQRKKLAKELRFQKNIMKDTTRKLKKIADLTTKTDEGSL